MLVNYVKPCEVVYKNVEIDEENQALIYVTVLRPFLSEGLRCPYTWIRRMLNVDSQSQASQFSPLLWLVVIGYSTN